MLLHEKSFSEKVHVLVNDASSDHVYLMEKDSINIIHEWELEYEIGEDY